MDDDVLVKLLLRTADEGHGPESSASGRTGEGERAVWFRCTVYCPPPY